MNRLLEQKLRKIIRNEIKRIVSLNDGIADVKRDARQYPGSYRLGISGRVKINGVTVTYLTYTNPNNSTDAAYIAYRYNGNDDGMTIREKDMHDRKAIESALEREI